MSADHESGNGYDKRIRALEETVSALKAQRQTVPTSAVMTGLGLALTLAGTMVVGFISQGERFQREVDNLDTRLQREARDLDHTLNVEISHTDEKFEAHVDRVVTFIESFKAWQISHTDSSSREFGDLNARLRALEKDAEAEDLRAAGR